MIAAVVQRKPKFSDSVGNTQSVIARMRRQPADLYVLPELFHSGYLFSSRRQVESLAEPVPTGPTSLALATAARELGAIIVAGIAERDGESCYNSAALFAPQGWVGTYRKIHLFDREKEWFSPGDRPFQIWTVGTLRLGLMICFDWIFPEAMRSLALQGAQIVCHPANLVLPYCQQAMITRCLENRVYALTANRIGRESDGAFTLDFTGKSQITGPDGDILLRAPSASTGVYTVAIDPQKADNKQMTTLNQLFDDRRPELYTL